MLYSNALGSPMPAPEGDVTLGIAQVRVPRRSGIFVEIRIEPDEVEARRAPRRRAVLTVVFDELGKERDNRAHPAALRARGHAATLHFNIGNGEVTRG